MKKQIINFLKKSKKSFSLFKYYLSDFRVYNNAGFYQTTDYSYDNLRGLITLNYHAIEKGLSHTNLRYGFGCKAINRLFDLLDIYIEKGFPTDDIRFTTAISVLNEYIEIHVDKSVISKVIDRFKKYRKYLHEDNNGGYREIEYNKKESNEDLSFDKLAKKRHSIREFSDTEVDTNKILEAINIASNSPSACNRQPNLVHVIKNYELIKEILELQGGLRGFTNFPKVLLMITSDVQYYGGPIERNAAYIDGGLFSMSLLYALEYKNLGACSLNASLNLKSEDKIKKLTNLNKNQKIIMFIAIGNKLDSYKVPFSQKDYSEDLISVIE